MERVEFGDDGGVRDGGRNKRFKKNEHQGDAKESSTDGGCPIHSLNDYCLAHIFRYLKPFDERVIVREVCTRWLDVSKYCWNDLKKLCVVTADDASEEEITIKRDFVHVMTEGGSGENAIMQLCGPFLRIIHDQRLYDSVIPLAVRYSRALEKLYVRIDTQEKMNSLIYLLMANKNLKVLHLQVLDDLQAHRCVQAINVNTLRELHLRINSFNEHLLKIVNGVIRDMINLESFECNVMNAEMIHVLATKKTLKSLALVAEREMILPVHQILNLDNLEYLSIKSDECDWLSNKFVQLLVTKCPQLKQIEFLDATHLTDDIFKSLSKLQNLISFIITDAPHIQGEQVWHCQKLESLGLIRCPVDNELVKTLVERMPPLKKLHLYGSRITNEVLLSINDAVRCRPNGNQLEIHIDRRANGDVANQSSLFIINVGYW